MVIAELVRVSNETARTFYLEPGDLFNTPWIAGNPCDDNPCDDIIVVPPGFDQLIEDLIVPWECLTKTGLVITDTVSKESVRCIVAPYDMDTEKRDWLQFRGNAWAPIAQRWWIPLGQRHSWGAVGSSLELHLSFKDDSDHSEPSPVPEVAHFVNTMTCQPRNTVYLNMYDLSPEVVPFNARMCGMTNKSIGLWHCAIEVFGKEWSFCSTNSEDACGIRVSSQPRWHPVSIYRQSINLGTVSIKNNEVEELVRVRLAPHWCGGDYSVLRRNCIHFCVALSLALGVKPLPRRLTNAHELGVAIFDPIAMVSDWCIRAAALVSSSVSSSDG